MPQFTPAPIAFDPAPTSSVESPSRCILLTAFGLHQISGETTRIGTSASCQLIVPGGAAFQGIIQRQEEVIWIEAVDDTPLLVNGIRFRRSLIVDGDEIVLNGHEIRVAIDNGAATENSIPSIPSPISRHKALEEDLSLLSAEELCDRIAAEHALVEEFESGLEEGWYKLLAAIEAEMEQQQPGETATVFPGPSIEMDSSCQHILKIEAATKTADLIEAITADDVMTSTTAPGQQLPNGSELDDIGSTSTVQPESAGQINLRVSA